MPTSGLIAPTLPSSALPKGACGPTSALSASAMGSGGPTLGFGGQSLAQGIGLLPMAASGTSPSMSALSPGGVGLTSTPAPVSEDLKKELALQLQGLGKHISFAFKIIQAADLALGDGVQRAENDLIRMNLGHLKSVAEEADAMTMPMTRALKFNRITTIDGGYCEENVKVLVAQCEDVCARLSACSKLVRVVLPTPAKNSAT